jgi:hypothetical protein
MKRIVKRFLLHNQRESEAVKESDFIDLKQEVRSVNTDLSDQIKQMRKSLVRYAKIVHRGISIVGDYIYESLDDDSDEYARHKKFKNFHKVLNEDLSEFMDDSNIEIVDSMIGLTKNEINASRNKVQSVNKNDLDSIHEEAAVDK